MINVVVIVGIDGIKKLMYVFIDNVIVGVVNRNFIKYEKFVINFLNFLSVFEVYFEGFFVWGIVVESFV